ncbi:pimeloyl-ACP methyl ester carboxylesterase [Kibdelosporangium banguiense]|uniref:Pimeloyl-ACP methyl ester carboxylesterase n=1 Tax=Kibdelosporangium banguiense TaxID=1365924 RepID=A0ABS4TYJ2_9PSEU|nr:alpha/beta hydrolase [Kibdelosporangium banguiense]MBP2329459.1 pimeloyl-ACP methyl ester carboxylesterase [Kibdelosporangium banguiense]
MLKLRTGTAALALAALAVTVVATTPASAAPAKAAPAQCEEVRLPVSMTTGEPANQRLTGTLCVPSRKPVTTVQVLVPGGTYDQRYWSMAPAPGVPSYVESMTRAGIATLAIDRLGTGRSSQPPSAEFRPDTHTESVHQVLQKLRAGQIDDRRFKRVVLVGHSFGSAIATDIAVKYPRDIDGVVLTGIATKQNEAAMRAQERDMHRANQDPRFAHLGLDDGYITTKPGTRADWFYYRPTMLPATVALDETAAQPDVMTLGSAPSTSETSQASDIYRHIKDPVLIAVGEQDRVVCGGTGSDCSSSAALQAQEAPQFPPSARMRAVVIPAAGHSINQQLTAPVLFSAVQAWSARYVGPR